MSVTALDCSRSRRADFIPSWKSGTRPRSAV